MNAYVQDGVITVIFNRNPILVAQMSHHQIKFRFITVSWYVKFHVEVCFRIQIFGEVIASLYNTGVVDYVVELLLHGWVMLQVL